MIAPLEWRAPSRSSNLHQGELAGLDLLVAELAVEDVALLVEVAGTRGAGIVDLAAGHDLLDAVDGVVDDLAAAHRRLADVVLDRLAGGSLAVGDRHQHQAGVVIDLASVGIGIGRAGARLDLLEGPTALGR